MEFWLEYSIHGFITHIFAHFLTIINNNNNFSGASNDVLVALLAPRRGTTPALSQPLLHLTISGPLRALHHAAPRPFAVARQQLPAASLRRRVSVPDTVALADTPRGGGRVGSSEFTGWGRFCGRSFRVPSPAPAPFC